MKEMLSIRPAVPEDADTLVRFNMMMALESEGRELHPEKVRPGVMASLMNPERGRYYVAEKEDSIIGQLRITKEWSDWNNGEYWWIQNVFVDPPFRRQGVYTALHRHVLERSRAAGACGLQLYVDHENQTAQSVYASLGMRRSHYLIYEQEKS